MGDRQLETEPSIRNRGPGLENRELEPKSQDCFLFIYLEELSKSLQLRTHFPIQ